MACLFQYDRFIFRYNCFIHYSGEVIPNSIKVSLLEIDEKNTNLHRILWIVLFCGLSPRWLMLLWLLLRFWSGAGLMWLMRAANDSGDWIVLRKPHRSTSCAASTHTGHTARHNTSCAASTHTGHTARHNTSCAASTHTGHTARHNTSCAVSTHTGHTARHNTSCAASTPTGHTARHNTSCAASTHTGHTARHNLANLEYSKGNFRMGSVVTFIIHHVSFRVCFT